MKTLLVPTEQHDVMASTLEMALLVARKFDSYVEGFALRYDVENFITMDPVSGVAMDSVRQNEEEAARHARDLFHAFMGERNVPASSGAASLSYGWSEQAGGDNIIGSYGRVFDAIILGRPGSDPRGPRMGTLEAGLFESGRPVLIAPPVAPKQIGENILIAWNASTEQAHTTALALPLLQRAKAITVLNLQGGMVPGGPSGDQLAANLRRNGLPVEAKAVNTKGGADAGEAALAQAKSLGCDLLIKGAYTQSRLRQMIFGGATRHILANATIPVFMAH
jgi:nucleotide-binding universal stress UspA family protein